ncbi:MAG: AraC family transcriptional regulator [Clostridia bacterium]|jgi:two-component system, response regulator YesN|nr:AraC family transcriptional regulator [Clostridia bacterium]
MNDLDTTLLQTFEKAVGINCFVTDIEATGVIPGDGYAFCDKCYAKQIAVYGRAKCDNLMEYAAYQSVRWGGKYEFLCPAGAAFIAASGLSRGVLKYGLVAGPFMMVPLADFLADEFSGLFGSDTKDIEEVAKLLPYIEPHRVSSLADMLFMVEAYSQHRDSEDLRLAEETSTRYNEMFSVMQNINDSDSEYAYPIDTEKKLQRYITSGDKKNAQRALNEILGAIFFSSGADFVTIRTRVTELLVLLSRAAIEGGAEPSRIFGLNRDYLREIGRFTNEEELSNWLASMLSSFTGLVFAAPDAKHTETIQKVMEYVNTNYMNRITLNDVSEHVSFSVSYLSRMFKEEKGVSLTSYINEVRIRNAKMLIKQSDISLSQAAYLCGFDDQSYFSKVFRKITGTTPGKYREQK